MSFWGVCVNTGKTYKQKVLKAYHVSQAVLDTETVTTNDIVSLQVEVNGTSYLLCNLSIDQNILQAPINCTFSKGEVVTFSIRSDSDVEAAIHLIGYTLETPPSTKEVANDENPLANVTNIKMKTLKSRDCKNESSVKEDKENESPAENKQTDSKSTDKNTSKKNKNKKSKSEEKELSLTDMLNDACVEEEDEDDEYSPEEEEEENEIEEVEDEDDDEEGEEEEEENPEEDEDDDSDDDSIEVEEGEEIEEDLKESKEEKEILMDLPKKKKRPLSPSSAGRTPIPTKANKKAKIQDLSGSPTLTEPSAKKKKNKKLNVSDSGSVNENVNKIKTPKESGKKKEANNSSDENADTPKSSSSSKSEKKIGVGGTILEDLVIGTGAVATKGKKVSVYYEGRLKKTGKVFDKMTTGSCFKFRLGANEVIKAWDIGVVGMKVGGKRRIVAPPAMAYGKNGAPPKIPPNAILVFEVELKSVG